MKLYILIGLLLFVSCQNNDERAYLVGDIKYIDYPQSVDTLIGQLTRLSDDYYNGYMSICDTLVFFYNPMNRKYQYRCYNIKTRMHIADFFSVGRGTDEFYNVSPIHNTFRDVDNSVKSLFVAANEEELGVFNISESILKKGTIIEDVSEFKWRQHIGQPITTVYFFDGEIIGYMPERKHNVYDKEIVLPHFVRLDFDTKNVIDTIMVYSDVLEEQVKYRANNAVFGFSSALNSVNKKIACAMSFLEQIDIVDLSTKELKHVRFGDKSINDLIKQESDIKRVHFFVYASDNYIYAPMFGDGDIEQGANIINIFSWQGDFVKQYYIEKGFDQVQIDFDNGILYTYSQFTNELYSYQIELQ